MRKKYSGQWILATKIDYKSAYHQGILHFATALQTATQLPDEDLAIITLRLTFGGAPCLFEWGIMSEMNCNLANELLKCNDWDPHTLHALVQKEIPTCKYLNNDVLFATGQESIVDIPVDPQGYADVYINDTTGLTVDLPGTCNAEQLKAATPLTIEMITRPYDNYEPIPWEPMVAQDILKVEGGLAEAKVILRWHFNLWTLTVTLHKHKHIAQSGKIQKMIANSKTIKKALESTIRQLGHVGFIIPWVFHFLSRLRTLLARARNRRVITINKKCKNNLTLMLKILYKAMRGIDMNLLASAPPTDSITPTPALPALADTAIRACSRFPMT